VATAINRSLRIQPFPFPSVRLDNTNKPHSNEATWYNRLVHQDQDIQRITILTERGEDEGEIEGNICMQSQSGS